MKRIALCFFGLLRTYKYCFEAWKKIIESNPEYVFDIFICTSVTDMDVIIKIDKNDITAIKKHMEKIKTFYKNYNLKGFEVVEAKDELINEETHLIDIGKFKIQQLSEMGYRNYIGNEVVTVSQHERNMYQFYKMYVVNKLRMDCEKTNNFKYDLVIMCRPDLYISKSPLAEKEKYAHDLLFNLNLVDRKKIYWVTCLCIMSNSQFMDNIGKLIYYYGDYIDIPNQCKRHPKYTPMQIMLIPEHQMEAHISYVLGSTYYITDERYNGKQIGGAFMTQNWVRAKPDEYVVFNHFCRGSEYKMFDAPMKFISYRGNLKGIDVTNENKPEYVMKAIEKGYYVMVDVWFIEKYGDNDERGNVHYDKGCDYELIHPVSDKQKEWWYSTNEGWDRFNGKFEGVWYLGNLCAQYKVDEKFIRNSKLILHVRNIEALRNVTRKDNIEMKKVHYFYGDMNMHCMTSMGEIVVPAGLAVSTNSICCFPEVALGVHIDAPIGWEEMMYLKQWPFIVQDQFVAGICSNEIDNFSGKSIFTKFLM